MNRHKHMLALALAMAITFTSATALGQLSFKGEEQEVGERFDYNFMRAHDRGVYFRGGVGVGLMKSSITPPLQGEKPRTDSGAGMDTAFALGVFLKPRVALHATSAFMLMPERGTLSLGPGATFYPKEDRNLFVSASLLTTTYYDQAPDIHAFEQWGMGGEMSIGAGVWTGPKAAMGVAFTGGAVAFDLDRDMVSLQGARIGLGLTLSIN